MRVRIQLLREDGQVVATDEFPLGSGPLARSFGQHFREGTVRITDYAFIPEEEGQPSQGPLPAS